MFIEINVQGFSEFILTSVSLLFIFGHNLWLIGKKDRAKVRLEVNTSDVFPASDSAVKSERIVDFRAVSAKNSAPIENYRVEENSLVAEVKNDDAFYAALELHAHPIVLEHEKFVGYIASENAEAFVKPAFVAGTTNAPQRESYSKFAKAYFGSEQTDAFNLIVGHKLEIVPQNTHADLRDGKLIVKITFEGEPIAGLRVSNGCAELNGGKYLNHTLSDANGLAELTVENGEHWFVRTHFIRPHSDAENFDWESFWASLTFRI